MSQQEGAPSRATRRARAGVAALFFANGALFANLVPRYAEVKGDLHLTNAGFGSAVAAYGLGALVVGLLGGVLVSRWGSARVAALSTIGMAANLVFLGIAPSWVLLATALLLAGSLDSIADLGGNAHALRVERRYGRPILNSMHALWSIGAVVGGAMGVAAAAVHLALGWHLAVAGLLFAGLALVAWRFLLPGPDDVELNRATRAAKQRHRLPRTQLARNVVALGVIAAMAQVMEDIGATWSSVYLRDGLGAAAAVSGLGFTALQALQTVGRLLADRVVHRWGDRAVARAGAAFACVAMSLALAVPTAATTIAALGAVGLGIGTLIPASLRAADGIPGLPRGAGLALVGSIPRLALVVSPPLVGVVADAVSLRAALITIPVAAAMVLLLTRILPGRGREPSEQGD
jgi:MFS family permease